MKNPFRRPPTPEPPRPNYLQITLLEHELFGIEPPPNSAAEFTIRLRQLAAAGDSASSFKPGGIIPAPGEQFIAALDPDEEIWPLRPC